MNGKFTRVSEDIPDNIINAFGLGDKEKLIDEDPYQRLRATAEQRRAELRRELIRNGGNKQRIKKTTNNNKEQRISWDRNNDYDMSIEEAIDMTGRTIHRSASAVDMDSPPRNTIFDNLNQNVYTQKPTIWDPDIDSLEDINTISKELMKENEIRAQMKNRRERLAEEHAEKHKKWEAERLKSIKMVNNSSRANILLNQHTPLMLTSMDTVAANKFGMPDIQKAIEKDKERAEIAQRRMAEKKSIKRKGSSAPKWDPSQSLKVSSYQSYQSDWLDKHLDSLIDE